MNITANKPSRVTIARIIVLETVNCWQITIPRNSKIKVQITPIVLIAVTSTASSVDAMFEKMIEKGSKMSIATDTNANDYSEYLNRLTESGYSFYADNTIGGNLYSTYVNDEYIVNVMFIEAFAQTRVIIDDRKTFSLPGLASENVYEDKGKNVLILLSDGAVGWPGRMGYA